MGLRTECQKLAFAPDATVRLGIGSGDFLRQSIIEPIISGGNAPINPITTSVSSPNAVAALYGPKYGISRRSSAAAFGLLRLPAALTLCAVALISAIPYQWAPGSTVLSRNAESSGPAFRTALPLDSSALHKFQCIRRQAWPAAYSTFPGGPSRSSPFAASSRPPRKRAARPNIPAGSSGARRIEKLRSTNRLLSR